jgi:hypothetical protein
MLVAGLQQRWWQVCSDLSMFSLIKTCNRHLQSVSNGLLLYGQRVAATINHM